MTHPIATSTTAATFFGLSHTPVPPAGRRRCLLFGRGHGVVTGSTRMGDHITSYDVLLDSGRTVKANPSHLRFVDAP